MYDFNKSNVYDFQREKNRKKLSLLMPVGIALVILAVIVIAANSIYMEIIQLDEIGNLSGIYLKNLLFKVITFLAAFILFFSAFYTTSLALKKNINTFRHRNNLPQGRKLPGMLISTIVAFLGALAAKDQFYDKFLSFINATGFDLKDPVFSKDISFYIFARPFLLSVSDFFTTMLVLVTIYAGVMYFFSAYTGAGEAGVSSTILKEKAILLHFYVYICIFLLIKAVTYTFSKYDILYGTVLETKGANYNDVNIWLNYYRAAPFIILLIIAVSLVFFIKGKIKVTAIALAAFPVLYLLVSIYSSAFYSLVTKPNLGNYEYKYLKNNIAMTRQAYSLDKIKTYDFPETKKLTPEILARNPGTLNNIRVVDIESTLVSNIQLQSNTNFYTFRDGDIINYSINNRNIPIFITAREIDKSNLPDSSYLNTTYKYTHGYGIVINPINKTDKSGQVSFILSDLRQKSIDPALKVERPEIYYGELTSDNVIVNAKGIDEVDYDGTRSSRYNGKGGISLNFLNRLLFSINSGDLQMLISSYAENATLLLNREIVSRARKAVPFLSVDSDPYILLTKEGRLKWVLDAYTTSANYPYSQDYGAINYIRNSVKIIIDAYDGKVEYYIIDKNDPLIMTYDKIYPGIFKKDPLPKDIKDHMRYPELLFKIQTEMLKKYHLKPTDTDVATFYTKNDLWKISSYSPEKDTYSLKEIDAYYNMIKLPGNLGKEEELILMRPFSPSGEQKHNLVSWLAVRNSGENYGEMILFNFPKNTNIFGPNQIEVKIKQIDKISKDMTLWGQSGSDVYKGSLLVIPVESSILYVEPIYIRASGNSSIPEVREIVVGYQSGDEFIYGIGTNLGEAIKEMFIRAGSSTTDFDSSIDDTSSDTESTGIEGGDGGTGDTGGAAETGGSDSSDGAGEPGGDGGSGAAGDGVNTGKAGDINNSGKAGDKDSEGSTGGNATSGSNKTSVVDKATIEELIKQYDSIKKQLDQIGQLLNKLK